jgi:hypothetical protein
VPITTEPSPHRPPAGIVRLKISGTFETTSWMNGFWLLTTGTPAPGDLSDLATDCYGAYQTTLLTQMDEDSIQRRSDVEYFTSGGSIKASSLANHAGSVSGDNLPSSAAVVLSWVIESTYRGGKPRTYLGGQRHNDVDSNHTWSDAHVAACTTQAVAFLDAINSLAPGDITSVTLGTVHFFSGGLALDPPTFDPFLGAGAQKRICSQRRRLGPEL